FMPADGRRSPVGRSAARAVTSRSEGTGAPADLPPTAAAIGTATRAAVLADELSRRTRGDGRRDERREGVLEGLADFAAAQASGDADRAARSLERRVRAHLERGTLEVHLTDNRY